MASIERRQYKGNPPYWRVVFYHDKRKQHERFDDEDQAAKFKVLVEVHRGWPPGWTPGVGFAEAAERRGQSFADYAEKTITARLRADEQTRRAYLSMLRNHVNPVLGDVPLTSVDRFKVSEVATRMIGAGKSPKTIANVHGLLSSILSDAVADGLIPRNPAVGALPTLAGVKGEEMVFLTGPEWEQVETELPEGYRRDLARLLVGTGLRWSEATALQVHVVDLLDKRRLSVYRAWKRRGGLWELGEPKTRRSRRYVDLSPELVDLLVPYVAGKAPHELVFQTANGHPVRHTQFYERAWLPAVLRAGQCPQHRDPKGAPCGCPGTLTKRPRIHDLRHTHASWLIDDGVSLPEIQRRLGHESIQTTIDRYGHPSGATEAINAAVDKRLARDPLSGDRLTRGQPNEV